MKNLEEKQQKAKEMIKELKKLFPDAKIALNYSTPFELLVATILSAQCTDVLVNKVTANLFKKYKTLDDYVKADPQEFEQDIKSVTFYKNKAKNVLITAKMIKEKYNGKVPDTMEDLISLAGVARKTANVILISIYNKLEGIVVDTHVRRLSQLFGFTESNDPVKIEQDLMQIIPHENWGEISFLLINYGRKYSPARLTDYSQTPLAKYYIK
ncbi:MAG TPA: endonuclease III [Candidatus Nitrosocosmicus sp.]|nr:endonuclease III [Candidatus Nitrosocosmicus sp.]